MADGVGGTVMSRSGCGHYTGMIGSNGRLITATYGTQAKETCATYRVEIESDSWEEKRRTKERDSWCPRLLSPSGKCEDPDASLVSCLCVVDDKGLAFPGMALLTSLSWWSWLWGLSHAEGR